LPYFYRVYGEIHALSVFDPSRASGAAEAAVARRYRPVIRGMSDDAIIVSTK
jgi:hypothetical protein